MAASFASFEKARRTGQLLFRTVLEKALFSSPAACLKTIQQRLNTIASKTTPEAAQDRETLRSLAAAVEAITPAQFSRYQTLLGLLRPGGQLDWRPERTDDRLVIFTERIETLNFLKAHLEKGLKLKPAQIATLSGQESDDAKLQETVLKFGQEPEPVRVLIATDIARASTCITSPTSWFTSTTAQRRRGRLRPEATTPRGLPLHRVHQREDPR